MLQSSVCGAVCTSNNASSEVGLSQVAFMENGAQKHAPPQKPSATPMFSYDAKYATVITEPFAQPSFSLVTGEESFEGSFEESFEESF